MKNRNPNTAKSSEKRPRGRVKGTRITVQATNGVSALVARFSLTGTILTYQDAADVLAAKTGLKVTRADVWRLAKDLKDGIVPHKKNSLRIALGLPTEFPITATPCPHCGEVKAVKKCPCRRKPARRAYRYTEYPVWTLGDLSDLAVAQPDARVVVLGVGADYESVKVGWKRTE